MRDELGLGNIPWCPRMANRRLPNLVEAEDCQRTTVCLNTQGTSLQAAFKPAPFAITVPRPSARQSVPRPTREQVGTDSRSRASPLPGNSLLQANRGSETSQLLLG